MKQLFGDQMLLLPPVELRWLAICRPFIGTVFAFDVVATSAGERQSSRGRNREEALP